MSKHILVLGTSQQERLCTDPVDVAIESVRTVRTKER